MNKSEAAEALEKATKAYSTATPDAPAVPPEVQRVVEAADRYERSVGGIVDSSPYGNVEAREIVAAIRAYRSSQPEPLSARLARLTPGSVVRHVEGYSLNVVGNFPEHQHLAIVDANVLGIEHYCDITAILSESP